MELQQKDVKILKELLVDGRAPISLISGRTRLSREIVDYRIKRLLKEGVITRFGGIANESRLGYYLAQVMLNISIASKEENDKAITFLVNHPFVVTVIKCGGGYNFAIELIAKDITHFDLLLNEIAKEFGKELTSYEASIAAYQYKYTFGAGKLIEGLKEFGEATEVEYPSKPVTIDETDRRLLGLLDEDGRASLVELSQKLKISPDAVNYHLKNLSKDSIFTGTVPYIDLLKLGFQERIVILHLKNVQMTDNPLKSYIQNNPYIRYCVRHLGKMQLYMWICAESTEHFYKLLQEMQFAYKDIIQSIDDYDVFGRYKETSFPKGLTRVQSQS